MGRVSGGARFKGLRERAERYVPLLRRTLFSSHESSTSTTRTVSFRFLPFTRTVSPRKSCSFSIVLVCIEMTELSSLGESSTIRRFGACLRRRMAVATSLTAPPPPKTSAPRGT